MAYTFVQLDTWSTLQVTLKDQDNVAINVTGYTVTLRYKLNGGPVRERNMTLVTPAAGICSYTWDVHELDAGGELEYEVLITTAGGLNLTTRDARTLAVRPRLAD